MEFAKSPVAVVCAGAKSILDLPRTLEVLETHGCPVVGFRTTEFPSFFTRKSGLKLQASADSAAEMARIVAAQRQVLVGGGFTKGGGGMVICNPIPADSECLAADAAIRTALLEAEQKRVVGKDITPFLLAKVNELTRGDSLKANIALVENNARVGAQIAVELAKLGVYGGRGGEGRGEQEQLKRDREGISSTQKISSSADSPGSCDEDSSSYEPGESAEIRVIGGATVDYMCRPAKPGPLQTSLPGRIVARCGGVGRNIAEAVAGLSRASAEVGAGAARRTPVVELVTALGGDLAAETILTDCRTKNIAVKAVRDGAFSSAQYAAMLDGKGELVSAVADMDVFSLLQPGVNTGGCENQKLQIIDANVPEELIASLGSSCSATAGSLTEIWFEPVSIPKAVKFNCFSPGVCKLITPNVAELEAILRDRRAQVPPNRSAKEESGASFYSADYCAGLIRAFRGAVNGKTTVILTCGPEGCFVGGGGNSEDQHHNRKNAEKLPGSLAVVQATVARWRRDLHTEELLHGGSVLWIRPKRPATTVVNVTGAGDTLIGAMAWGRFVAGLNLGDSVVLGMVAATKTLQSDRPVAPDLHRLFEFAPPTGGAKL